MGEKNKGNKKGGDGGKKEIVLNVGCLCKGCESKIKSIRQFEGVENVKIESSNKVTVIGDVDPKAIVEKLRKKTGKIVFIQPRKDDNNKEKKPGKEENKDSDNKPKKVTEKDGNAADAGYPGHMLGYPGYGHPGYWNGYGHPHPHLHWHGYEHGYPGYVPVYPAVHPPHYSGQWQT